MRDTASTPLLSPERADASIRVLRAPSPRVSRAAPDGTGATPSALVRPQFPELDAVDVTKPLSESQD